MWADTFEDCDAIFAAAAEANQTVRGHNLCWHTENPGWLKNGNFTPAQLRGVLQSHIHTVVTHYGTHVRSRSLTRGDDSCTDEFMHLGRPTVFGVLLVLHL